MRYILAVFMGTVTFYMSIELFLLSFPRHINLKAVCDEIREAG